MTTPPATGAYVARAGDWMIPCGCTYRPGITLPVRECGPHEDDPSLPHPWWDEPQSAPSRGDS